MTKAPTTRPRKKVDAEALCFIDWPLELTLRVIAVNVDGADDIVAISLSSLPFVFYSQRYV